MLAETFADTGDPKGIIAWLCWWLRRSLSGDCSSEAFVFLFGRSGSGKSTLYETWQAVLGGYAAVVPGERLAGERTVHREWLARVAGARLIVVNELPERGRWATADLNALVSGEMITANFMRQGSFEFRSQASVIIVGNHAPPVRRRAGA